MAPKLTPLPGFKLPERTMLTPEEENQFLAWATLNKIKDVDHPDNRYDYRGYWKQIASKGNNATKMYADGLHFTDQFKQHGHPTFSIESRYSRGPWDGGMWNQETYLPQMTPAPAHKRKK